MSFIDDLNVLYSLTLAPRSGNTHAERMESFYRRQAAAYDSFRERLLKGRREMLESLPWGELQGGSWVDLGAGTGANIEFVANRVGSLETVHLVDLSDSLLEVARNRIARNGWKNVHVELEDATRFVPSGRSVDLVTFSYSLTMIPDWVAAVDHAWDLLRPGGVIGVVDFHVSREVEPPSRQSHDWLTRKFWPAWFGLDGVILNPEHSHYLRSRFEETSYQESRARLPYFPLGTAPYYRFVGRKS